jgi:hypothetical protein
VNVSRRFFLCTAAGMTVVLAQARPALAARIGALFNHTESALWLGRRAAASLALPGDPTLVLAELDGGSFIGRARGLRSDDALRQYIQALQRRDFAAERTVELDGWILSDTEARICAALACGC